jgi:hypothetical protein
LILPYRGTTAIRLNVVTDVETSADSCLSRIENGDKSSRDNGRVPKTSYCVKGSVKRGSLVGSGVSLRRANSDVFSVRIALCVLAGPLNMSLS